MDALSPVFLPLLSKVRDAAEELARRARFTPQATLAAGLATVAGFALAGPPVFLAVFGPRYAEGIVFVGLLGVVFGLQLARSGPNIVAMVCGHTLNMLVSNLVRLAFLPLALLVAIRGGDAVDVVAVGAVGQLFGYVTVIAMLWHSGDVTDLRPMLLPFLAGGAVLVVAGWTISETSGPALPLWPSLATLAALGLTVLACRAMRRELRRRLRRKV